MKSISLMARAISYLSRREYSRYELRQKLTPYATSKEDIEAVLDKLVALNYQSDARFVESFIRLKSHWGAYKILYALSQHHLDPILIEGVKDRLKQNELERALSVWEKRFKGKAPKDYKEYTLQARFLASRGFDLSVVNQVLKMTPQEISDKMDLF